MPKTAKTKLKTYRVRLEYHCVVRDEVEAESEEDAIRIAQEQTSGNMIAMEASLYDASADSKTSKSQWR